MFIAVFLLFFLRGEHFHQFYYRFCWVQPTFSRYCSMFWLVMDVSVMKSNSSLIVMMATPRFSKNSGGKDPGQSRTTPEPSNFTQWTDQTESSCSVPPDHSHYCSPSWGTPEHEDDHVPRTETHQWCRHLRCGTCRQTRTSENCETEPERTFLKGSTYSMLNSLRSAWTRRASWNIFLMFCTTCR